MESERMFDDPSAPGELLMHNHSGTSSGKWLKAVYKAAAAEQKLLQMRRTAINLGLPTIPAIKARRTT